MKLQERYIETMDYYLKNYHTRSPGELSAEIYAVAISYFNVMDKPFEINLSRYPGAIRTPNTSLEKTLFNLNLDSKYVTIVKKDKNETIRNASWHSINP